MASASKKIVIGAVAVTALAAASAQVAPQTIGDVPVVGYVGVEYVPVDPDANLEKGGSVQPSIEACGAACVATPDCNAMSYYSDASHLKGTDKNCWLKKLADPCAGVPDGAYLDDKVIFAIRTDTCAEGDPVYAPTEDLTPAPPPAPVPAEEEVVPAPGEAPTAPVPAEEEVAPAPAEEATAPVPAEEVAAPEPVAVSGDPPVAEAPVEDDAEAPVESSDRSFGLEPEEAEGAEGPTTGDEGSSEGDEPTTRDLDAETAGAMSLRSAAIAAVVAGVAAVLA